MGAIRSDTQVLGDTSDARKLLVLNFKLSKLASIRLCMNDER